MKPLRIAFLDSWLQSAAEGSGTAVAIGGLGAELRRQGHHIERIAPRSDGWRARVPLTWRRLIFNLLLPWRLRTAHYDLIVGFDWDGVFLKAGGWRLKTGRSKTPQSRGFKRQPATPRYICSIKGIVAEELQHEQGRIRLLFTLLAKLEGINARRADRVVTTSEYCRRKIVEHYGVPAERIGIVPEGIDLGNWESGARNRSEDEEGSSQRLTSTLQPRRILCVARQYPRKHVDDLIKAFALIHRRVPHACLRIVGDGPEHAHLAAVTHQLGIADRVTLTGSIPDDAVKREYMQCDLFCLPSVQEGFGIVFLEAMAAGKPVVSTTATAIPEVVRHGETGILVPPGDVRALAGALLLLLTDEERRLRYGLAGRKRVEMYRWRLVAEQFLQEVTTIM